MYSYKTGLGQVWVGAKLPPNPGSNIIWLRPSDDHRVLWEIRTYNIYKERWEVLTSAALTADGLLILIRDLEKRCKSLEELKVVLYDTIQNLTPEEQKIARQNIGAISLEDLHLDENVTRLAIELTINDEKVYSVVTPLETLTEHYRKFLADPTKYVWQLYLKVGEDQLGLVPLFIITYGGLHIGFYSPDLSGETKYVSLNTNGDVVIRATVNNYGPTLVEVVQSTGDSTEKVMSQKAVTEELSKKASLESVTESISVHNTSTIAHADIRELLNTCVGLPAYDSSSYKITFTTLAGATVEIDLPIEQLALRYNAETESIEFDNADGTTTSIPVSAFVKEYVGSIGDRIQVSIDENNVIHATILKNSIDWDCLSFELQERINDHVTSADFATKAVRTDITQTLSIEAQNQALKNIGTDLMIIDLVNGQATLTDEQEAALLSCKGVILRGTVNAGKEVLTKIYFSDYQGGDQVSFWAVRNNEYILQCVYTKSTKLFRFLTLAGFIDRNAVSIKKQTLNATQQEQALANLGMKVYVTDSSFLGSTLSAEEIEEVFVSKAILFTDTGDLFSFGAASSSQIYFYKFINRSFIGYITLNKPSGLVSNGSFEYQDVNAVSFNIDQSNVSNDRKNKALGNIGIDLVRLPYSLLGTTLSDEMLEVVDNARGIILVDTPSDYRNPTVFVKGNNVSGSCIFVAFVTGNTYCIFTLNKSTKLLSGVSSGLTYGGSVRYAEEQSLTTAQQEVALSNIGLGFVIVDYSELSTTLSDDRLSQLVNAKGFILTNTPDDYTRSVVFTAGTKLVSTITFSSIEDFQDINYIVLNIPNKVLSLVQTSKLVISNFNQNLTNTEKDTVLSNIGLDFVHVDYSLLGTVLSDTMASSVTNAKGIIITNIPDTTNLPDIYLSGAKSSSNILNFVSFYTDGTLSNITFTISTKVLGNPSFKLTNAYSVVYNTSQSITDTQKQQARSNIDAVGSSMIKGVEIVYGTAPMQEDNILYIELEETT
nr:MAG TPA: hypothetical protein [Crassvirales sp.]